MYNQVILLAIFLALDSIFYIECLGNKTFGVKTISGKTVGDAFDRGTSLEAGCTALIVIESALFGQIPSLLPQVKH